MAGGRRTRLPTQGKRSQVEINESALLGNAKSIDSFFEAATSVEEKKDDKEGRGRPSLQSKETAPSKSEVTKPKRAAKTDVRLSLPGQKDDESQTSEGDARHREPRRGLMLTSPSEISRVSTLPPTPGTGSKEVEDDVEVLRHSFAEKEHQDNLPMEEPGDFPPLDNDEGDGDDDGDDLAPPIMDDDEEEEEEEMKRQDVQPVATTVADAEREFSDGDDGPRTSLAHDDDESIDSQQDLKPRGRKKRSRVSFDSQESTPARKPKKKRQQRRGPFSPKGIPIGNREYTRVPIVEPSPEDVGGLRRSRRNRIKPLEFWRNEYVEYGPPSLEFAEEYADMPVPKRLVKAGETPYRKRKDSEYAKSNSRNKKSKSKAVKRKNDDDLDDDDDNNSFDAAQLKKQYKKNLKSGEYAELWDDLLADIEDQRVIAYASKLKKVENYLLPIDEIPPEEAKNVGKAAQAFNLDGDPSGERTGFIMGNLTLPPGGKKDPESVGPCIQTFTVVSGQKKAIELVFAHPDCDEAVVEEKTAQRYLLEPGDLFWIPPGNTYLIQNHSTSKPCKLTWTIIRPKEHFQSGVEDED